MTTRFAVTTPNVMHQTIDGEVIVIDARTGMYYSLRATGAAIWHSIDQGHSIDEIEAELRRRYDASDEEIRGAVRGLLGELVREGLVQAAAEDAAPAARPSSSDESDDRLPFEPPSLEKHADMKAMILIDPVHQVGSLGWPHRANADQARA
jgi:Coenzyme PQQ synthesis protein D (PqqD)